MISVSVALRGRSTTWLVLPAPDDWSAEPKGNDDSKVIPADLGSKQLVTLD